MRIKVVKAQWILVVALFAPASPSFASPGFCARAWGRFLGAFGATKPYDDNWAELDSSNPDPLTVRFMASSPKPLHRLTAVEKVELLPEAERYPFLVRRLADKDDGVRIAALDKLTSLSPPLDKTSEIPIGEALGDSNPEVRAAAIKLLVGRNDPHSLASLRHAIFGITWMNFKSPDPGELMNGYRHFPSSEVGWKLLQMKRDAIRAFEGRSDAGAVDLIDQILQTTITGPVGEYKPIDDWYSTLLGFLSFAKSHGTPEVQEHISQIVQQRESTRGWSAYALELLRTPSRTTWYDGAGGGNPPGYRGVSEFTATPLYTQLVELPGQPAEARWGWDDGWEDYLPENRHRRLDGD